MKYCFGIDVGGTTLKLGLFSEEGVLLEKWHIPTPTGDPKGLYDQAAASVLQKMDACSLKREDVLGIGIDMPGPVDREGKLGLAPNLKISGGSPASELSRRLDHLFAAAANDADAAAFGEMCAGAGKGYRSLCMITLGTGVGGGLAADGKIIQGLNGAAGEIGHLRVEDGETEACSCGGYGCCEWYASAAGIVRTAERILINGDPKKAVTAIQKREFQKKIAGLSAEMICENARKGDKTAQQTLSFAMDRLGKALSFVTYTLDPEVFVLGGGVAVSADVLLPYLEKALIRYTPLLRDAKRKIVTAKLGNDAGIYGCAWMILKHFSEMSA